MIYYTCDEMSGSGSLVDMFKFPEDWEVIGTGTNKYQVGLENRYLVIDTASDVLTALIFSGKIDIRQITELASWSLVRRVKINGHDSEIHKHPEGFRKLLTWYCTTSKLTFLIHFSKDQTELVQAFRKTKCH